MQCWSRRNRGGTTDHRLRRCPLRHSCCIRPLQCLNTFHKLPDQIALRFRIQHGKEKHQGRGRSGVFSAFQIAVCTTGNAKLLCHSFLRQRLLPPQGRKLPGKKLREQRRVWCGFILRTSIGYKFYGDFMSKRSVLPRSALRVLRCRYLLSVQSL